jgi:hypothetical protein
VQGGVAFDAGDGVAFEAFLVEKHVDYFVCGGCQLGDSIVKLALANLAQDYILRAYMHGDK